MKEAFYPVSVQKIVLKLDVNDEKTKKKVLRAVSSLQGIASISMDMKEKKLTVTGNVDAVDIVRKVRKVWPSADILSVGPEKEEKKKEEPKKEEAKAKSQTEQMADLVKAYEALHCNPTAHHYYHCEAQNPNACVIS